MTRFTRTLFISAVALTLPLAGFAGTATSQTKTTAPATSTPAAKPHMVHARQSSAAPAMHATTVSTKSTTSREAGTKPATSTKPARTKSTTTRWVDLNDGTKEDLMKLSGMTDTLADAIIAGRPYTSKAQLLDKKIVDAKTYKKISHYLSLKAPATGKPAGQ